MEGHETFLGKRYSKENWATLLYLTLGRIVKIDTSSKWDFTESIEMTN